MTTISLDVKNVFLYEVLVEVVYMEIPPGFENGQTRGKVVNSRNSCMESNGHHKCGLKGSQGS